MSLPFPTRLNPQPGNHTGYPAHPQACQCGAQQALDEIGCCWRCGRWPASTIAETWDQRKRQLARRSRAKAAA